MLDVDKIRRDFPILRSNVIYLDNASSSLTPEPVLQKMAEFYHEYRANVARGVHRFSRRASEAYEMVHSKIANFINAESEREIILTKNATEAINLVANGSSWRNGDKIVTSVIEHHSNFIVWLRLKRRYHVDIEILRPNNEGLFHVDDLERAVDDKTRLVSITHASNALGSITPIQQVAKIAHDHGAKLMVDGAQSVPHMEVDVQEIGCDYLAFSGHKMLGPTGIGVLYVNSELLEELDPPNIGGGAISDVGLDFYRLTESSARFEAGTPPIAEALGLGEAAEYLKEIELRNVEAHERELTNRLRHGLSGIPGVEIYGPENAEDRLGITSFNVGNLNPHDVALALDISEGILVRSGHHCCLPLMKELLKRPEGTVRASLYIYNTIEEVEKLISTVDTIAR